VEWDGKTSTVYIGKLSQTGFDINLKDMDYFTQSAQTYIAGLQSSYKWVDTYNSFQPLDTFTANSGKVYGQGLGFYGSEETDNDWEIDNNKFAFSRTYLLNSEYSKFEGIFALAYEDRDDNSALANLIIYADGKEVYNGTTGSGIEPKKINIDLTGVLQLEIKMSSAGTVPSKSYTFAIVDSGFYK